MSIFSSEDWASMVDASIRIGYLADDSMWHATMDDMPLWGHFVYDETGDPENGPGELCRYFVEDNPSTPGENLEIAERELWDDLNPTPTCPQCNSPLIVTYHYTRQYGGGYDTFVKCTGCNFREVGV